MNASSHLFAIGAFLVVSMTITAQPRIIKQPESQSVSLGANVNLEVRASSATPPIAYQWQHADKVLPGATSPTLNINDVQMTHAGPYTVAVSDINGTNVSRTALLEVDPTFTKITTGEIVTDKRHWHGQAWGDYDSDGDLDLFLVTTESNWNPIYRNNGDGTFTRILEPSLQGHHHNGNWFFHWVDYDNDGHLDLFLPDASAFFGGNYRNLLLHNKGDQTFTRVTDCPIAQDGAVSTAGAWGDYDRDGDLDLLVANGGLVGRATANWFYVNQGQGSFLKSSGGLIEPLISEARADTFPTWVDVDDDGWLDLFVSASGVNSLFLNTRDGGFTKITADPLVTQPGNWSGMAWADYDNDGDLDVLLTANGYPTATRPLALFRNEGSGRFSKLTADDIGPLATAVANSWGCAWGDYDNDGWVDLIIADGWFQSERRRPLMYRNQGDGTFIKVTTGSPANEVGACLAVNWVDYDQDGALDLFVTDHDEGSLWANRLFRNNGNANAWLEIKCVGTSSPRWGTGAKVRVKTTIGETERWQLRLIDAGGTPFGGHSFVAHFGLGAAATVDVLRIEWPSGIVQELRDVATSQCLTVTEPTTLRPIAAGSFVVLGGQGMQYEIQASTNLRDWTVLDSITNLTGVLTFSDPAPASQPQRFYRALAPRPCADADFDLQPQH
jgi:enediyne biosynthesis protein E4